MAKRRGDDAEGSVTSTGRLGKGSENGWSAERRDLKKPGPEASEVYGFGKDGVEGWRSTK